MNRVVPSDAVAVRATPSPGCARTVSSGAYGWTNTNCTECASEARTSFTTPGRPRSNVGQTAPLARLDPLEARRHLGGGHRAAVVEAHAVTQGERPGQTIARHRPASREGRIHVRRAFAIGNQGVEDLPSDQRAGTVEVGGRIERGRDAGDADAQLLACLRGGVGTGARRKAPEEAPNSSSRGARREPRRSLIAIFYRWNPLHALAVSRASTRGRSPVRNLLNARQSGSDA